MNARLILIALALAAATPASAQSCGTNNGGSCTISGLNISISFTRAFQMSLSSTSTALTVPTTASYDAGYAATDGPVITISSNAAWTLGINASSAFWAATNTGSEAARTNKPSTDLAWSTTVGGTFTGMTTTPTTVQSGAAASGAVVNLFYRTAYTWGLDTPGNYSIQIVFTLTAP